MDDISFFESVKYQHRGGIWADASRAHADTSYEPRQEESEDSKTTVSASGVELSKPMPTDPEHPPVQRSYSAEEAKTEAKVDNDSQEAFVEIRRTTTAVSLPSSPAANMSSDSRRRRTWLGAPEEEDGDEVKLDNGGEADWRGRTPDSENTLTRRSSSTPLASSDDIAPQPTEAQQLREDYLAPSVSRRSSSQHSQASSRETSGSVTDEESASGPGDSSSSSWRSKSPGLSSSSNRTNNATSSTAAFLQTLKSRAGDKQALSNTAKEAMRKWGVNWSGLRKDSTNSTHSEDVADGASAPQNDTRVRANSAAHRSRPSYAEVRAAVERRHQESTLGADLRSDPISIPQGGKGKERARSVSPSPAEGGGSSSGGGSPYLAPPPSGPPHKPDSRSSSPTFERTASGHSVPGLMPEESEERPSAPIHTQPPQAKTMTIPGIHASHRGEVMSMGYAPPPPPPASPPEQKKQPAIQSVYRLWNKNPSQTPRGTESPPVAITQTETGFAGRDQDAPAASSAAVAATSDAQAQPEVVSPRPVPPPLPPRSISGTLSKSSGAAAQGAGPSAASAALQSIVSKDRSKRASLEPAPPSGPGEDRDALGTGAGGNGSPQIPVVDSSPGGSPASGTPKPSPVPPALPPRRLPAAAASAPAAA